MTDGNHHVNKYIKNTDPNDISLFGGRAYFPDDTQYQEYLQLLSRDQALQWPLLITSRVILIQHF